MNEKSEPLPRAAVIAMSPVPDTKTKWAPVDEDGRYQLELEVGQDFTLQVSYLGYEKATFFLKASDLISEYDFHMKVASQELGEVVINYQYSPMVIKKDTIIFRLDAYISGDERKLKEALEKLPGMEVDDWGQVRFQGNVVNKTLVESRLFFGGGSKLAVEHIPADAVDKIELISNFSEVDFLKDLLTGEELAMNVQLKNDRKNLVFGDLEASAGTDKNHLFHTALFKFSPEKNISFIGDINSLGKAVFTIDDVFRFQGSSPYILSTNRPSFSDLFALTSSNPNLLKHQNTFGALHYDQEINERWQVSGFGLFSQNKRESLSQSLIEYIANDSNRVEWRENQQSEAGNLAIADIKVEFAPDKFQEGYYNGQISINDFQSQGDLVSSSELAGDQNFMTRRDDKNLSLNQYIEWHRSLSLRHTMTAVVSHHYKNEKPMYTWINSQPFLTSYLPLTNADTYHLDRTQKVQIHNLDAVMKHYWVFNSVSQLHTSLGVQFHHTRLFSEHGQRCSDGSFYNFRDAGFGNQLEYRLHDYYLGMDYRLVYKKFESTLTVVAHAYDLNVDQTVNQLHISRKFFKFNPSWTSVLELKKWEKLHLDYTYRHRLPAAEQLSESYSVTNYNTVFKGNAVLDDAYYHTLLMRYNKMLSGSNAVLNASSQFSKNFKTIKNLVEYEGLNSFRTPVIIDDPESNWSAYGSIQRGFWKLIPSVSARWSWSQYYQSVNALLSNSQRFNQTYTGGLRLNQKGWPDIRLNYTKTYSKLQGNNIISFESDRFNGRMTYRFLKNLLVSGQYQYQENRNQQTAQVHSSQQLSSSIEYDPAASGWAFYVSGHNLLSNRILTSQTITEYIITEQTRHILPRSVLLGVRYKL